MSQTRIGMFRRWFDYERDSHRKVLGALEAVPVERRDAPEFRKLYHRGQIALLLRAVGAEPVPTDFLFWTREALDPALG